MIKIITNSLGCGDWVRVEHIHGDRLHDGHNITPNDLAEILHRLGIYAEVVEVTDEQMEEM